MGLYGHEDDVHSEVLEARWKDFCFVVQSHTCARHARSSVETVKAGCRKSVVGLGERKEMDYPVHWSVAVEKSRIWS